MSMRFVALLMITVVPCAAVAGESTAAEMSRHIPPAAAPELVEALLKVAAARWRPAWEEYIKNETEGEDRYAFLHEPADEWEEQFAFHQRICKLSAPSTEPLLAVLASDHKTIQPHALYCVVLMCMDEGFPRDRAVELVVPLVDSKDELVKRAAEEALRMLVEVSDPSRLAVWQKGKREWMARWESRREAKQRRSARPSVPIVAPKPSETTS